MNTWLEGLEDCKDLLSDRDSLVHPGQVVFKSMGAWDMEGDRVSVEFRYNPRREHTCANHSMAALERFMGMVADLESSISLTDK